MTVLVRIPTEVKKEYDNIKVPLSTSFLTKIEFPEFVRRSVLESMEKLKEELKEKTGK